VNVVSAHVCCGQTVAISATAELFFIFFILSSAQYRIVCVFLFFYLSAVHISSVRRPALLGLQDGISDNSLP